MPLDAIRDDRAARAGRRDRVRRRGLRRVRRRDVHPRARRVSRTSIVGRTFSKAYGLAGLRIGALVGAPDDARSDPAARSRSTASTSPRSSRVRAALDDRDHLHGYLRQVERVEGAALRGLRSARADVLEERRELRARPRRATATDALVDGAARARHLPPRPVDRAGLRRLHPHRRPASSSTRAACIAALEEVLCAAR